MTDLFIFICYIHSFYVQRDITTELNVVLYKEILLLLLLLLFTVFVKVALVVTVVLFAVVIVVELVDVFFYVAVVIVISVDKIVLLKYLYGHLCVQLSKRSQKAMK